jgi:hypothetical protein
MFKILILRRDLALRPGTWVTVAFPEKKTISLWNFYQKRNFHIAHRSSVLFFIFVGYRRQSVLGEAVCP